MTREQVIKGLECCVNVEMYDSSGCEICPYRVTGMTAIICRELMYKDALALLKAQDTELERLKNCRAECKIDCLLKEYNALKEKYDGLMKAQEPVKPIERNGFYYCGVCRYAFTVHKQKRCSKCGRAAKWE